MTFDQQLLSRCWFLAGPTASGKSAAALELAQRLNAEIVALDSMSLYRTMDIGTAKPDAAARCQVPHHLLDILEPHVDFSVSDYLRAAEGACHEIVSRDRIPLFVGGTGLYLRAILRGIFEGPPANWELRQSLAAEAERHGVETVHQRLAAADPTAAARLHPQDLRRVIRAIEVFEATGVPLSRQQRELPLPAESRPRHVYWLCPDRRWLAERIDRRVEEMFAAGLVAEVERLRGADKPLSRTASQGLGYKEVLDHLDGKLTLPETMTLIQTRTRQFAKRQFTWFRNLEECIAIPVDGTETPRSIAERLWPGG